MVTNLPAEAKAKWVKVMEARTLEEKIQALEDFLSSVPKHKGTEKLRLWATKRLAELREELEERKRKRVGRGELFFVEKEGAAQVVVIGPPGSGKSTLVHRLTGAKTVISHVPFATKRPAVGMLRYEDVLFQLVDTPPIVPGGGPFNAKVMGLCRNADMVLVVLDATSDPLDSFERIRKEMEESGLILGRPRGKVEIERYKVGKTGVRVTIMGRLLGMTVEDIRKLLNEYGIYNAHVKIVGDVTIDDVENAIFGNVLYKPYVVVINKVDALDRVSAERIAGAAKSIGALTVSALAGSGLDLLPKKIFDTLEIIRVYTKHPNAPPSPKPLILRAGATVKDVAEKIHEDFVERFLYAKVWGPSAKYPGERVGLDHVLKDGDIVEIRIKG